MSYTLSTRQDRRTAAQFTASNPTPLSGQLCIETDTARAKAGDGSTAWASLPYISLSADERRSADDVYAASREVASNGTVPKRYVANVTFVAEGEPVIDAILVDDIGGIAFKWSATGILNIISDGGMFTQGKTTAFVTPIESAAAAMIDAELKGSNRIDLSIHSVDTKLEFDADGLTFTIHVEVYP